MASYLVLGVIEMLRVLRPGPRSGRLETDPLRVGVGRPSYDDRVSGSGNGCAAVHALVGTQEKEKLEVAARDVVENRQCHHHGRHPNQKINCRGERTRNRIFRKDGLCSTMHHVKLKSLLTRCCRLV